MLDFMTPPKSPMRWRPRLSTCCSTVEIFYLIANMWSLMIYKNYMILILQLCLDQCCLRFGTTSVDWNRHRDLDRMPADDPFDRRGRFLALRYSGLFWIYDVPRWYHEIHSKSLNISEHDFGAQKINIPCMLCFAEVFFVGHCHIKTGGIDRTGKLIKLAPWITLAWVNSFGAFLK